MPPLRRYLRISAHTTLEVRIYPTSPADAGSRWLLHPTSPVLPRVIAAVRPLVLPKLREENEIARKKGKGKGKRKGWKDTVVTEEFECSVFLTETSARHAVLRREKVVRGKRGKMTGEVVSLRRESSEEGEGVALADVPAAGQEGADGDGTGTKGEELFISEGSEDEDTQLRRRGRRSPEAADAEGGDDKKKLGLRTVYDGFSIYGRILCLVVKRKEEARGKESATESGQAMMEEWIASTQAAAE
ncbi:hypothetical protein MMC21_006911 [Puttea exsequens]|nr:hypothetical protein [Puttea exsequens]